MEYTPRHATGCSPQNPAMQAFIKVPLWPHTPRCPQESKTFSGQLPPQSRHCCVFLGSCSPPLKLKPEIRLGAQSTVMKSELRALLDGWQQLRVLADLPTVQVGLSASGPSDAVAKTRRPPPTQAV